MSNLLLFNKLKQITELLQRLIARTIRTSIGMIIGLPTIRKHDLVLKIPTQATDGDYDDDDDEKDDGDKDD